MKYIMLFIKKILCIIIYLFIVIRRSTIIP